MTASAPTRRPRHESKSGETSQAALLRQRWMLQRNRKTDQPVHDSAWTAGLLDLIFAQSPFLSHAALRAPDIVDALETAGPQALIEAELDTVQALTCNDKRATMRALRHAKTRVALLTALADLGEAWDLDAVTGALSRFADIAVDRALAQALFDAIKRGQLADSEAQASTSTCGIFVLGMGKLGAHELNYSSDIDLIILYDRERMAVLGDDGAMPVMSGIVRNLVSVLEETTREGYVFRTDLRLRPNLGIQPLAMAEDDALTYYERHGQNWERAAMIKARVIAGDGRAGERFLRDLQPFIWRKHLDFAAIKDIHSIKRQIDSFRGHGTIKLAGHDVKVGRGGIREIEFFTQTQQLILGGRHPELRSSRTVDTLALLAKQGWIDQSVADELTHAYRELRRIEHRLQMVEDKQTQRLPTREADLARLAAFLGYADLGAFQTELLGLLETVERHYAALFESSPSLGQEGSLVFTGTSDNADTLDTLQRLGFAKPDLVSGRIRAWHHGHIRATRSARARELLTELTPKLLSVLAAQPSPDDAFARFDKMISGLPAGVQLFSLIHPHPHLLDLLADLSGIAPPLAEHLARHTELFETLLVPSQDEQGVADASLEKSLARELTQARDLQDRLELTARWARGRQFAIGLDILLGRRNGDEACAELTAIADTVLAALLPVAGGWLEEAHGRLPELRFGVLGLGKLGSGELTLGSDLDVVFIYDGPGEARSDGDRPLSLADYASRLGVRLVNALTMRTNEGRLYEIDTRLRPSGNVGPPAVRLDVFERYQRETAQTWEHQALTRARWVAGDADLGERVIAVAHAVVASEREIESLRRDVVAMRARIYREHGSRDLWNLKHVRGGFVDAEFLAQFLQLAHGQAHREIIGGATAEVFARAGACGLLDREDARPLAAHLQLYHRLQAILRLVDEDARSSERFTQGLRSALARAGDSEHIAGTFDDLETQLAAAHRHTALLFDQVVGPLHDDGKTNKEHKAP
ncbi:MAG: bifunctional [glutamine synthetase] adenylyltransferase/[glutamine synthetase]-adenylyl-L-tyrosine phosphorylase [Geminicoccaceae bacterium]